MKRIFFLTYGIFGCLVLMSTILYAIGFLGDLGLGNAMDAEPGTAFFPALLINASLLMLIVMQYNVVKSARFQQSLLQRFPMPLQRSMQVLFLSLGFLFVMWRWQPIGITVWSVEGSVIQPFLKISYLTGWSILLISTFLAKHFDLFGVRQAWCYYRREKYVQAPVLEPGHYQLIRHPFYIGFLLVCWSASLMTLVHLLFSLIVTAYVAIALQQERKGPVVQVRNPYMQYEE